MSTVTEKASLLVRRLASSLGTLLPGPPQRDARPPDVDGRRDTGSDHDMAAIEVRMHAKDGHGGANQQVAVE